MFATNVFSQNKETIKHYAVDTTESYLFWKCDIHYGKVPLKSGYLDVKNEEIKSGKFVIKMDSIKDKDIDYELMRKTLENTLRSNVFFDTKKYPFSTFEIYYSNKKNNKYYIMGNLTILDIPVCVSFPARLSFTKDSFEAVSDTFKINRLDWGITIYSREDPADDGSVVISDSLTIQIFLKGDLKKTD